MAQWHSGRVAKMPYVTHDPIEASEWRQRIADERDGASVEFLGTVRGEEQGRPITQIVYDAYEPMAERLIARLIADANARWPLHQVEVRHRVGRVAVGDIAVLVRVRSAHREEAFAACRFLIDGIKQEAPIWKIAAG